MDFLKHILVPTLGITGFYPYDVCNIFFKYCKKFIFCPFGQLKRVI